MRNLILLSVIFGGIFALTGCQSFTNLAKGGLKPNDISLDKPVAVKDLIDGVLADKEAWKGKEVAVTGHVSATSGAGGKFGYALTLKNDPQASGGDTTIGCYVPQGDIPTGILNKTVVVKGIVDHIRDQHKNVSLKSCTLIQ